jgi:polyisoprenoid-binding protein YceI
MHATGIVGLVLSVVFTVGLADRAQSAGMSTDWQIDPAHSTASFAVKHMMVSNVRGNLGAVQGRAVYDGKHLPAAFVTATIDAAGIDTHNAQRDEDLRSDQFLDTKKYPTVTFKSSKFESTSDGLRVHGDLTIHGVTKQVVLLSDAPTAIVKDPWGHYRFGVSAHTRINRKDFGITYNKLLDNGGAIVADDVAIQLDIEMTQQAH